MSLPVEATFTFTRQEYVLAIRRHYKSVLNIPRDIVVGVGAVGVGLFLALSSIVGWVAWPMVAFGATLLLMVVFAIFLLPTLIFNSQPKLKDQYRLSFSDEGIGFKTKDVDARLEWSMYHSWLF